MSFEKIPTEFSKLLKNKNDPEIIYQKTFIKNHTKQKNIVSFFLRKTKENPIILILIIINYLISFFCNIYNYNFT